MARKKNLDHQQLQQHYAVNPDPEFLPALKSDLLERFPERQIRPNKSRKLMYACIAAVVVLMIIFFATPMGRALAQELVELFQRAENDVEPWYPAQTLIAGTATAQYQATLAPDQVIDQGYEATIGSDSVFTDWMILALVERAAEYDIYEPAYLPDNFELVGTSFDPETGIVRLIYDHDSENSLILDQEPVSNNENCDLCTELGPSSAISTVQIGDLEGEYIIGSWEQDNGNNSWNSGLDFQTLRWESDDMVFNLSYQGNPDEMTKSEMIMIASGLVTRIPDPSSYESATMTIEEAEEAAGFDVLVPAQVPSTFEFIGGSYLPEESISLLFYKLLGPGTSGLVISQEPVTGMEDCDLCTEIGPSGIIHTVQIGDVEGQFVIGTWELKDGNKVWSYDPWNLWLRWQTNDTVFQIMFFGPPVTMQKSDMAHLAESMSSSNAPLAIYANTPTPTQPEDTNTPDPELIENATMTIEEVQQAAAFDILLPNYLADLEFYGANFDPTTNIVYLFYQENLIIRQELITGIGDCDLCAEVRSGASSKFVQVGENEAEYLFGVWLFTDQNNVTTAVAQPQQLRWQDNNMFFDICYDDTPNDLGREELDYDITQCKISLDDLIQIAESMH